MNNIYKNIYYILYIIYICGWQFMKLINEVVFPDSEPPTVNILCRCSRI